MLTRELETAEMRFLGAQQKISRHFDVSDPRVNNWPLMDSPVTTMLIVAVYLYLVVILGPRLMANRKPFQLNSVLVAYNAAQVIFSIAMLWEVRRPRANTDSTTRQLPISPKAIILYQATVDHR